MLSYNVVDIRCRLIAQDVVNFLDFNPVSAVNFCSRSSAGALEFTTLAASITYTECPEFYRVLAVSSALPWHLQRSMEKRELMAVSMFRTICVLLAAVEYE